MKDITIHIEHNCYGIIKLFFTNTYTSLYLIWKNTQVSMSIANEITSSNISMMS